MPTVSVIIPNYNHAKYIVERIDSVLNQTYQDFELIILDDYSTDDSKQLIEQYRANPKVSEIVYNTQNSGSTFKQWNKGIELAKGKYIWIAESDDWAEPTFLETVVNEFKKNQKAKVVYTNGKIIDENNNISLHNEERNTGEIITYSGEFFIKKHLSNGTAIWNASMMMFEKSITPKKESQKLYSSMRLCGDWFFYILLAEQNIDVVEIKQTLNHFRKHSNNISSKAEKNGLTFVEGLDILKYLKPKFTMRQQLGLAKGWAKKLCRYKERYNYSKETTKKILKITRSEHTIVYILYLFFNRYYSLQQRLSIRKKEDDNSAVPH